MNTFQKNIKEWGLKTFPMATKDSIICHLQKEVKELKESYNPEEAADCFILLCHLANKLGCDLLEEAEKKMVINKQRKWGKPDKDGVVEHIRF
jgi:NTP pyrophosphatase (non-canonical NTP hydrolase)